MATPNIVVSVAGLQLRQREIDDGVRRSRRILTERIAGFITRRQARAVPKASGQVDNPKVVAVQQDHRPKLRPR